MFKNMEPDREFESRIATIHGLDNPKPGSRTDEVPDIRHLEFRAMVDVFLGADFDSTKVKQIEALQIDLDKEQACLYTEYKAERLAPEEYVDRVNAAIANTFEKFESVLGRESFLKVFQAPKSECAAFIDKDAFLKARQAHRRHK